MRVAPREDGCPAEFDRLEVARVHEFSDDEGGTFCEPADTMEDEEAKRSFWSVYGHHATGTVTCLGDFTRQRAALEVVACILGRGVSMGEHELWADFAIERR